MSPFLGEIIGTMLLIVLGDGVVAGVLLNKSKAQNSGWIVITLAWGLAVAIAIYAVGGVSGAHLNPAVTIGLALIGKFPWENVPTYILAQMIGAWHISNRCQQVYGWIESIDRRFLYCKYRSLIRRNYRICD